MSCSQNMPTTTATPAAMNNATNNTMATTVMTVVGVTFRRGRGSGSPSPEV